MSQSLEVLIVGGGMITNDQILPSIYQLQRDGLVGEISISALNGTPLKALAENPSFIQAFPGQSFKAYPDFKKVDPEQKFPSLFREVLGKMKPRQLVAVALPDQMHYDAVKSALEANQNVLCVKPLVLKFEQAEELEALAYSKGLFVGVEYHKRFDPRSLIARKRFRNGDFGEFRVGQARLMEPWYYRHSNFQNWCVCENSDAFAYVACHYIDLVAFMTGLLPVEVNVKGIVERYPNGREGYLYTDGRVVWNNGAILNVQNCLGYPNDAPSGNSQGMMLFFRGGEKGDTGGYLEHSDSYRGGKHGLVHKNLGDKYYHETNPDYFQLIPHGGEGLAAHGYGYKSIEAITKGALRVNAAGSDVLARQKVLDEIDEQGIIATPKNSKYNELVMEAGRLSILSGGRDVVIDYGTHAGVHLKKESEYKAK